MDLRQKLYSPATLILPHSVMEKRQARLAEHDIREAGIVFIHVPRTAGFSVMQAVYQSTALRHFTIQQFLQVSAPDLKGLPRFAIVRNPWDRAVSAYHFARQGGVRDGAQMLHAGRYRGSMFATFDTFVHTYLAVRDVRKLDGVFRPQRYYVGDGAEFDHIGRFDRISESQAWLSETLRRPVELPQSNSTPRGDYRAYYSDATRRIIADKYREDIIHFGFEF